MRMSVSNAMLTILMMVDSAAASGTSGADSCPCLAADAKIFEKTHAKSDCNKSYFEAANCITVTVEAKSALYATDYGIGCNSQLEPGHSSCWDLEKDVALPQGGAEENGTEAKVRASWCDSAWCYIDPCKCNAADAAESTYFGTGAGMFYSYSTCGAKDEYTSTETSISAGKGCPGSNVNSSVRGGAANVWAALLAVLYCIFSRSL